MAKINWGRVILGGVVFTVVFNVLWIFALILFLKSEWMRALTALGRTYPETLGGLALWLSLTFIAGIFVIWLYAAIRPLYGPGPKTAACAGFALWLVGVLVPMLWFWWILLLPTALVASSTVVELVAVVVATVLGAWPYKEE